MIKKYSREHFFRAVGNCAVLREENYFDFPYLDDHSGLRGATTQRYEQISDILSSWCEIRDEEFEFIDFGCGEVPFAPIYQPNKYLLVESSKRIFENLRLEYGRSLRQSLDERKENAVLAILGGTFGNYPSAYWRLILDRVRPKFVLIQYQDIELGLNRSSSQIQNSIDHYFNWLRDLLERCDGPKIKVASPRRVVNRNKNVYMLASVSGNADAFFDNGKPVNSVCFFSTRYFDSKRINLALGDYSIRRQETLDEARTFKLALLERKA